MITACIFSGSVCRAGSRLADCVVGGGAAGTLVHPAAAPLATANVAIHLNRMRCAAHQVIDVPSRSIKAWSPTNANGALSAPVLTPETSPKRGRASGCDPGADCHT